MRKKRTKSVRTWTTKKEIHSIPDTNQSGHRPGLTHAGKPKSNRNWSKIPIQVTTQDERYIWIKILFIHVTLYKQESCRQTNSCTFTELVREDVDR